MAEPLIKFYEDRHLYLHKNIPINSVSSWVDAYSGTFNSDYWLEYKVLERLFPDIFKEVKEKFYKGRSQPNKSFFDKIKKRLGINQIFLYKKEIYKIKNEWLLKNVTATSKGSSFHLMEEWRTIEEGYCINPFTDEKFETIDLRRKDVEYQNHSTCMNPYDELPDGFFPEMLLWNLSIPMVGQADMVFIKTIGKDRFFWIDDFKTNGEDKMKPSAGMGKMKGVLSEFTSNAINKYGKIQIPMYCWMMEQHGFKFGGASFTWYRNYDRNDSKQFIVDYDSELTNKIIRNRHLLDN